MPGSYICVWNSGEGYNDNLLDSIYEEYGYDSISYTMSSELITDIKLNMARKRIKRIYY